MQQPRIDIDPGSGFCFGVVTAIRKAEETLNSCETLYCLGDIVHNSDEVDRLCQRGLVTITHSDLQNLKGVKVLLRAHGEPPTTYDTAKANGIQIIDATCPVVLRLQQRVKQAAQNPDIQIVIYGKNGHAEVNGLVGQTGGRAIVVENINDLDKVDMTQDIALFSQTTKSPQGLAAMINEINKRISPGVHFEHHDTICRQVSGRAESLRRFAAEKEVVLFVSGAKSSNGKVLCAVCSSVNPNTYLISNPSEINPEWIRGVTSIGICGATSTPRWLMEKVRDKVLLLL